MDEHIDDWSDSAEPKLLGRFEAAADLIGAVLIGLIAVGIAYRSRSE
jgi:hypothetical protein